MVSFVQKGPLRPEPSSGNINKIYGSRGINVQGGRGAMLDSYTKRASIEAWKLI